jgi:putative transposase
METGCGRLGDDGHVTDERQYRDDDRAVQLALFRYGVIAPLAERKSPAPGEVSATVREIAGREHYLPGKGPIRISKRTIYAWLAAYRRGGIDMLRPKRRKDRGRSRVLDDPILERAITLRKEQLKRTTATILDILVLEGSVPENLPFHRATLDRHLRRRGMSRRQQKTLSTRRHIKMVFKNFGDLWVGDYHHGPPVLAPDGRVTTAKICGFLDHCTRYPVVSRYYLSEAFATLRDALLRAFLVFGLAKVVYVDRGSVFRAEQLAYSLKRLKSHLVHSKAYYSEGRGLIERWWQLLAEFETEVRGQERLLTIHEINAYWEAFRERRYCHVVHSGIGRTPAQAIAEVGHRPLDPAVARELFLVGEQRTVHKKTCCVSVLNQEFLCESFLKSKRVRVRFDPRDLSWVLIFYDGKKVQTAFPRPVNAPESLPTPEELSRSVDYLELLRRDYDQKLLEHAKPLAYAQLELDPGFDVDRFLAVVGDLAGLALRAPEKRALVAFFETFGPLPEDLVRIGVEHAVRMQGRKRHVDVYLHAIRTLVLAHWRGRKESP